MIAVGIKLVDFKIEIGRIWENDYQRLIVADEISPDSCRLWDIETRPQARQGRVPPRPRLADRRLYRSGAAAGRAAVERDARDEAHADQLAGAGRRPEQRAALPKGEADRRKMKARVHVMLKDGVLDPQGEAVRHALGTLGFAGVEGVRQGKVIELDLSETDRAKAEADGEGDVREAARQHGDRKLPGRDRLSGRFFYEKSGLWR